MLESGKSTPGEPDLVDAPDEPGEPEQKAPAATTPASPNLDDTAVTKWLRERFSEAFAEAFHREGYYDLEDVDDEAIERIVSRKGSANRLKADLKARLHPMVPPDLPPGTLLDLSKPTITSASGVTFAVPTTLSVNRTADAIQPPNALQNAD